MTKKSVDTIREELRVLNAAANDGIPQNEWITPEFVAMVSSVVVNLLSAATLVGWVDASSAQEIAKAATAILTGVGTVVVNGLLVWKYLSGRQAIRAQMVEARYHYMETLAIEKMRASSSTR